MKNKIAVLIPAYNHAKYLPSLFDSLLMQDYTNLHIHVSNDGSTDNTSDIMVKYMDKLSQKFSVTMTNHLFNLGDQGRKNIEYLTSEIPADCDYVSIIESDDYLKCNKRFSKILAKFSSNCSIGAVHTDVMAQYEDGSICPAFWKKYRVTQTGDPNIPQGKITEYLKVCNFIMTCSLVVKKDLYLKAFDYSLFNKKEIFLGDYAGVLRLSKLTNIAYIDEPLSVYRILANSSSHADRPKIISDTVKIQLLARTGELFSNLE